MEGWNVKEKVNSRLAKVQNPGLNLSMELATSGNDSFTVLHRKPVQVKEWKNAKFLFNVGKLKEKQ